MTWQETHRRWQIQRELEANLAVDPRTPLTWRPEFSDVFTDTAQLRQFLGYRWNLRREAQLDPDLTDLALDERIASLATARAGIAALARCVENPEGQPRAVA